MIEEIAIADLGAITSARLELGPGLTVITGETGAGKTMLLTGLELLLGGAGDPGAVREGTERATVEGTFLLEAGGPVARRAQEAGAAVEDGALLVSRTVPAGGRSRAYAGGRTVPRALLGELGEHLVTIHGQSDQLRLRSPARQRATLDDYAGPEHRAVLADYRGVWARLTEAEEELAHWQARSSDREAEAARLRAGLTLLEDLEPRAGEDAELRAEAERLTNVEDRRDAATTAYTALGGSRDEPSAPDASVLVAQAVQALDGDDPLLRGLAERLTATTHQLTDITADLVTYLDDLAADPQRLQHVHERRAALRDATVRLALTDVDELAAWSRDGAQRLSELDDPGDAAARIEGEVRELRERLAGFAIQLTAGRRRGAAELGDAVGEELGGLAMPGAALHVSLHELAEPGPWGGEDVSIALRPHPGAPPRPLGQGASGGELSRVMLAIEVALAARGAADGRLPTFVFDEVDAGVGGRAATEVGRRLARLAATTQVIVVTHLAQVAAFADHHLLVTKESDDTTTATGVARITDERRRQELARMLSGQEDSTVARRHAAELLELAAVAR